MRPLALIAIVLATACEPQLPDGWPHDAGTDAGITFLPIEGGHSVQLDAQSSERWTALDLDAPAEVPFEADRWDLAFQRFHIRARGGASGDGGVQVAIVQGAGFDDVHRAPAGPWVEDQPDGPDENTDLDTAFEKPEAWYDYEPTFHSLTPRPWVYVVKSDRGAYFKLVIDAYYDRAGTPALFKLRIGQVPPP
jgi:hypothetical protein